MRPSTIGRYQVISELGRGAMGIVYKAVDPILDRTVAIKTLSLYLSKEELNEYEARFYQEAKATGQINHPNIVSLYDVGKTDDMAYMAMEYLEGQELRQILDSKKQLSIAQIVDIVTQIAEGLSFAHSHNIVHRDIKPSNIMIVKNGLAKITDFGIARMPSSAVKTMTGMVMGSPQYMSPEQVTGKQTDRRTDIFSLGVILYEMLAGEPPFKGENVHAIMFQILNWAPPPPKSINPDVPQILNYIVAKALAKKPEDRYQSAQDLIRDLKECADELHKGEPEGALPTARFVPEEESEQALSISNLFNSVDATIKLASMTGMTKAFHFPEPEENVEEDNALIWIAIIAVSLLVIGAAAIL